MRAFFAGMLLCALAIPALATVDDAQSFALEAATPWVKQGMEIRYDYARGTAISGQKVRVSYQVFKGNRYWFFAGGSEDGIRMEIAVTDDRGQPVAGTTGSGINSATFQFTAARTMMVTIDMTGHSQPNQEFGWALVYGFQASKRTGAGVSAPQTGP